MLKIQKITKEGGIMAEDGAVIVQQASRHKSDIYIIKGNKKINAKSLIGLLSLKLRFGEEIILSVDGDDEIEAMEGLIKLF